MLQVKTPALVLDKEPLYNDDGNITLFTKNFGILKLTASGIKRRGASLASWTEPPTSVVADITIQEGKSFGYGRLLTLSLKNYFPHIRSSYENTSWFYFYCFLIKNFLPHGTKSEKSYNLLREVLEFQKLWGDAERRDLNFIYFLVRLLRIEGICSQFRDCLKCGKRFKENETAYFTPREQGLLCDNCSKKVVRAILSLTSVVAGPVPFGGRAGKHKLPLRDSISLDFLKLLPQGKTLNLPEGLLRINSEERMVLETCEKSERIEQSFANIFSRPKINDQTFAKVRNFLLIFLAPLL